jgi:hypothetical protein
LAGQPTVPANERVRFEGSANFPYEFRVAMILLAQQISSSQRTARWFEFPAEQLLESNLENALQSPQVERFSGNKLIKDALEVGLTHDARDLSIERIQRWLSVVNRFSFDLTRR